MGLWTLSHLYQIAPTFLVLGVLAVLAAKLFKNSSVSTKYIPLQVIAVLLLVLEIGKQISAFKNGSYDLSYFTDSYGKADVSEIWKIFQKGKF